MLEIRAQTLRADGSIKPSLVMIDQGVIQSIATIPRNDCETHMLLCPGLFDLQVNGAGGVLFNQSPDLVSLITMGSTLVQFGTTGWLPTLVTDDVATMEKAANAVAQAIKDPTSGVKGIHFEGPHLSVEKKGVHNAEYIRPISEQELTIYQRDDLGAKLLTVAPEVVSPEQIEQLVKAGCTVSLGHTNADYDTCMNAIEAGASCFTHLYNAMSGLQGRAPGAIGAALSSGLPYGLIMDGYHVHPTMINLAHKLNQNMVLITDAMPVIGTENTTFEWYGQTIHREDDRLLDAEGRLAGACLTQNQALANTMLQLGLSIEDVIPMATTAPARVMGLEESLASISPGAVADLVLLDETGEIGQVWRAGNSVYQA